MYLQHYFDRIGYRGDARPELPVLFALQRAHVCAIPFENIDIQLGRPVTIGAEEAYEKLVVNGRGGWCYEQNALLGWALAEIGFDVTRMAAAVMRQERGAIAEANHLCLSVRCPAASEAYLVDAGFGGSMIQPIRLIESEYSQPPFRIGLKTLADGRWRFWEDLGSGAFSFDFVAEPANEEALAEKCVFMQSDPASSFVLNLVAQLRAPDQHKSLRGRVFRIATPAGTRSTTLDSADAVVATLADQFRLDVPEVADLWPRIAARHAEYQRTKS